MACKVTGVTRTRISVGGREAVLVELQRLQREQRLVGAVEHEQGIHARHAGLADQHSLRETVEIVVQDPERRLRIMLATQERHRAVERANLLRRRDRLSVRPRRLGIDDRCPWGEHSRDRRGSNFGGPQGGGR